MHPESEGWAQNGCRGCTRSQAEEYEEEYEEEPPPPPPKKKRVKKAPPRPPPEPEPEPEPAPEEIPDPVEIANKRRLEEAREKMEHAKAMADRMRRQGPPEALTAQALTFSGPFLDINPSGDRVIGKFWRK